MTSIQDKAWAFQVAPNDYRNFTECIQSINPVGDFDIVFGLYLNVDVLGTYNIKVTATIPSGRFDWIFDGVQLGDYGVYWLGFPTTNKYAVGKHTLEYAIISKV